MTEMTRKKLSTGQIWLIVGLFVAGLFVINLFARWLLQSSYYKSASADNDFALLSPAYSSSLPDVSSIFRLDAFSETTGAVASAPTAMPAALAQVPAAEAGQADRLIIRSGAITMVVDDTRATYQSVVQMVSEMAGDGAFVVASNERGGTGDKPPQISITIRVPAAQFTEVMDRLAAMAVEVVDRTESGQDVTEEYVDVQAKIESLEAARQRLLEIVREARNTDDLLKAEQVLTQREQEIDSLKGRLQYLAQSARLSSISIELRPSILNQPVAPGWRPSETVRRAVERLVERFQDFVDVLIVFVIADLPWWLGFGLAVFGAVRLGLWWWRRRNKRSQPLAATAPAKTDESS